MSDSLHTDVQEPEVVQNSPAVDPLRLQIAVEEFDKQFHQRSVYGRNPERGKMIKCALCGLRHRATECHMTEQKFANKPGTPEGESNPMVAQVKHLRPIGNPFWRAHPGTFQWIADLKKFVRIVR